MVRVGWRWATCEHPSTGEVLGIALWLLGSAETVYMETLDGSWRAISYEANFNSLARCCEKKIRDDWVKLRFYDDSGKELGH